MKINLTACLEHGKKKPYVYLWTPRQRDDANVTITVLLKTLMKIAKVNRINTESYPDRNRNTHTSNEMDSLTRV